MSHYALIILYKIAKKIPGKKYTKNEKKRVLTTFRSETKKLN